MKNKERLNEPLRYIDANLDKKLSLNHLANMWGYSPFHFSRVFSWGLGLSVMDYVNKRKMEYAGYYLSTNMRILDIALELGFETHSGFSKSFKKYYKCSPAKYRVYSTSSKPSLPNLDHLDRYTLGGIIMKPRIIKQEAIHLIGYSITTTNIQNENNKDIPMLWQDYLSSGKMKKLHTEPFIESHHEYGVCLPLNSDQTTFDYMIGVSVSAPLKANHYSSNTIPAGTFAVFTVPTSNDQSFSNNIQNTWNYIFNEWFPSSDYEFDDTSFDYEFYPVNGLDDETQACEIYCPIRKKVD